MKNSKILFQDFIKQITVDETPEEIRSIAHLVFEKLFDLSKTDILAEKNISVNESVYTRLLEIADRLNQHEPIQYIFGEAFFFRRIFEVSPAVLIPRPETEELVADVLRFSKADKRVLDIGTGSGCIPITLSLEIPSSSIFATDISDQALAIAEKNAENLKATVTFFKHDILTEELPVRDLDIIVSNPPYIVDEESKLMKQNVLLHEPHLALFVPGNDPLVFYRAIAEKAANALKPGGCLETEINPLFASETTAIFAQHGFRDITILKDISGKDRIVRALNSFRR